MTAIGKCPCESCRESRKDAEIRRLRDLLHSIARVTSPSTRTFDQSIRDMGLANDLARSVLEK